MHRSIHDVNLGWGQFLDYYSDLNNARKENDETRATKKSDFDDDTVISFANDVEWLSTYKSVAAPAQVTRALQEIHEQIRR